MDLQTQKIELAKMLLETEDVSLLNEIKNLFVKRERDFWDELPKQVKDGIYRGLNQAKEGLVTPHEEVMKKHEKYL
ncbi:hypothetical protein I5M32_00200 [Pedobacter sp. SD-b]|uniref:Addiction module component n=1 Tax=Pedobacter segetis TaxID=2793069 RepID=A0ABS1BES0_9SPHI|nr:hypothetical protein [Pedobacter segetis]MBK0381364.1 hypothetical protein [Pedobacter segetis]